MSLTSASPERIQALNAPPRITSAVQEFLEELQKHAGYNLVGLILYGGLANGNYQFDRSDVNVVVLLRDASIPRVKEISHVLRTAWTNARIEPMLITPDEVRKSADTFPTKFLHIKRNHIVLFGENPFALLDVPRPFVRLRVEQELRNCVLRMRRLFVTAQEDSYQLANYLAKLSSTIEVEFASLLELAGKQDLSQLASGKKTYAAIVEAAAQQFELDGEALLKLPDYRRKQFDVEDVQQIYGRVLASIIKAADVADGLE